MLSDEEREIMDIPSYVANLKEIPRALTKEEKIIIILHDDKEQLRVEATDWAESWKRVSDENLAVAAHLRELEGKLCRVGKAFGRAKPATTGHNPIIWNGSWVVSAEDARIISVESSAPCPHATRAEKAKGEAKRMRDILQWVMEDCANAGACHLCALIKQKLEEVK